MRAWWTRSRWIRNWATWESLSAPMPGCWNFCCGSRICPWSPVWRGDAAGGVYNVNAEQMAVSCATPFGAERLVFLTDVGGVRDVGGRIQETLTPAGASALIRDGVATGGMRAKLEAACAALRKGIPAVRIAPGVPGTVQKLLAGNGIGTRLIF